MIPKNITLTKKQFNENVAELKKKKHLSDYYIFVNGDTGELTLNYSNVKFVRYDANMNKDYDEMMLWKCWEDGWNNLTYDNYAKLLKEIRREWYGEKEEESIWQKMSAGELGMLALFIIGFLAELGSGRWFS